jgi:hypothetical protein
MEKINITEELEYLMQIQKPYISSSFTVGVAIQVDEMSDYIADCYDLAESTQYGMHGDISIGYHLDLINNTMIVFTEVCIEDYDGDCDHNEVDLNAHHLYVEIYTSREDFMKGALAIYHEENAAANSHWWTDQDDNFCTDDEGYNNIDMIKDAQLLLTLQELEDLAS